MIKFIFKDTEKNTELVLPVTPPDFQVSHGINIETINIHALGDVALAGYGTLPALKIDCMFPGKEYPFNQPETELDPYKYTKKFEDWCDNRTVLRFVISSTSVNIPVLINDISYGERDGTGDVYATITLRQYRMLNVVQISYTGNNTRGSENTVEEQSYIIQSGDTLNSICRKFYGDESLDAKLATYNNIKNPNIIYMGTTLKIPDRNAL